MSLAWTSGDRRTDYRDETSLALLYGVRGPSSRRAERPAVKDSALSSGAKAVPAFQYSSNAFRGAPVRSASSVFTKRDSNSCRKRVDLAALKALYIEDDGLHDNERVYGSAPGQCSHNAEHMLGGERALTQKTTFPDALSPMEKFFIKPQTKLALKRACDHSRNTPVHLMTHKLGITCARGTVSVQFAKDSPETLRRRRLR